MSDSHIYSVSEINQEVKQLLAHHFPSILVRGEISGFTAHRSGHWYFKLKDKQASIDCAMFSSNNRSSSFNPGDGDLVQVQARVELYEPYGRFQLVVHEMEPEGRGELLRQIEELKARLKAEGLFDPQHKQPLPPYPDVVGVVTSRSGAALHDITQTLSRRWPVARLQIYSAAVQGETAPASLVAALNQASRDLKCSVLILARGGGSMEDLQAFNHESVVRAVFACPHPVVTGVGHETDTLLVDYVADERAPTPTAAAERVSPDGSALLKQWQRQLQRLCHGARSRLGTLGQDLKFEYQRLNNAHPRMHMDAYQQQLDDFFDRMQRDLRRQLAQHSDRLTLIQHRLSVASPQSRISNLQQGLQQSHQQLRAAVQVKWQATHARLQQAQATLNAAGPTQTLQRGYAIATLQTAQGEQVLRRANQAAVGTALKLRLGDGSLRAKVTHTTNKS